MLLHDETRRARRQRLLIAAEKCRRSRLRNGIYDIQRRWIGFQAPDTEHKAFAVYDCDDAVCGRAGHQKIISPRECLGHDSGNLIGSHLAKGRKTRSEEKGKDADAPLHPQILE